MKIHEAVKVVEDTVAAPAKLLNVTNAQPVTLSADEAKYHGLPEGNYVFVDARVAVPVTAE